MEGQTENLIEVDLIHLLKSLYKRIWIIIISAVLCGCIAFISTYLLITPMYKASVKMYVNNSSFSVGNTSFSISSSELSAAKTLVDTYIVILQTRTTLNEVIKDADIDYSYNQLNDMIEARAVRATEVFEIIVTTPDPSDSKLIANTIANILPDKISDIVEGSSVRVVEYAVTPEQRSSPSYSKNTMIGAMLGVLISAGGIIIYCMFDKYIHSEDYLTQTYDIPLLAVIPNLGKTKTKTSLRYYGYGEK